MPAANSNTTRSYPSCVPTRTSVICARSVVDATLTEGAQANGGRLFVGSLDVAESSALASGGAEIEGSAPVESMAESLGPAEPGEALPAEHPASATVAMRPSAANAAREDCGRVMARCSLPEARRWVLRPALRRRPGRFRYAPS